MRYFVTLNGRESSPSLETAPSGAQHLAAFGTDGVSGRELCGEILRPRQPGRAALVCVDGRVFRVAFEGAVPGAAAKSRRVRINGSLCQLELETELERRARPAPTASRAAGTRITAPMPGRIVKVNVRPGDVVLAGAALLSVEAMKMENELQAPRAGRVTSVLVQAGATVDADQELIVITPEP
jgi:glutaconyl-CoA/methylmalonyl-CoA decarboxylase subunit gamma